MKQLYLSDDRTISTVEVSKPDPVGNKVLINVKATGICGTDVHGYLGETIFGRLYPFHFGHEVAGLVEAVGPDCKKIAVGDHVIIDPLIACGVCDECRDAHSQFCDRNTTIGRTGPGGFSDYVMMPEGEVYSFSKELSFTQACLAEPLACVIHGDELAGIKLGDNVLIKGAGAIGQMHMKVAKLMGAATVTICDFNVLKLNKAKALGADYIINASCAAIEDYKAIAPRGFDVIIDCTGSAKSVSACAPLVRKHGMILIFGVCPIGSEVTFDPHDIYMREIQIRGSFCFPKDTLIKSLRLLETGRIDGTELISAVMRRDELAAVIEDIHAGKYDGKIVISQED